MAKITPGDASLINKFLAYAVRQNFGSNSEQKRIINICEFIMVPFSIGTETEITIKENE